MAANHIPVIDLSKLGQDTGDRLVDAVHKWGFAFVKGSNTGFTAQLINHIFDLVRYVRSRWNWLLPATSAADRLADSRKLSSNRPSKKRSDVLSA